MSSAMVTSLIVCCGVYRWSRSTPSCPGRCGRGRRALVDAEDRWVEPLTPRELTVLGLLPTHLSYAQIGERLYLSVNTAKTNLKSTYRKLHVTSRAAAVEAGLELGLVDGPRQPSR